MGKISNYVRVLKAKLQDVFVIDSTDNNVTTTKSVTVEQIGDAICGEQVHADLETDDQTIIGGINENKDKVGDLTALTTTDKSSLVGAVNEIARYTPVYGNTASGAIATFDTSLALPLQDCTIAINAVQESGTPTPSSPKLIGGFTGANIAVYNENLFTSMATSTADGITTSYDSTTGYISITNDSRSTNYSTGSTREHVATGLNSSHTYKYEIYPNVTGVILFGGGVTVLSKDGFTGYTTVDLRITKDYDFVNDHPIGSLTKVRLVLYDVTTGELNTYPISWQDEAGTVYGGSLDVTSGKLVIKYARIKISDMTWNIGSGFFYSSLPLKKNGTTNIHCECLRVVDVSSVSEMVNGDIKGHPVNNNMYIKNTDWASATDLYNAIGDYYIVYELATPATYQLTPTQISAIVGTNNVFTDTNGDTSVVYACSLKDYIDSQ